jgi:hypothetical protein
MTSGSAGPPNIRSLIGGAPAPFDVDELELESARRALRVLRERITPEQMEALLSADLDRADDAWRLWAASSDGPWQLAEVEFVVTGVSKAQFLDWWSAALDDIQGVIYPGFPEHYRFGWVKDPRGGADPCYLVIEELGYVPFRMYSAFDPSWAPVQTLPGYDSMLVGVGFLRDGTQIARFMNQIADTPEGFTMRVGVYFVSGVPKEVVQSHVKQELVEWTRWIEMATKRVRGN